MIKLIKCWLGFHKYVPFYSHVFKREYVICNCCGKNGIKFKTLGNTYLIKII